MMHLMSIAESGLPIHFQGVNVWAQIRVHGARNVLPRMQKRGRKKQMLSLPTTPCWRLKLLTLTPSCLNAMR